MNNGERLPKTMIEVRTSPRATRWPDGVESELPTHVTSLAWHANRRSRASTFPPHLPPPPFHHPAHRLGPPLITNNHHGSRTKHPSALWHREPYDALERAVVYNPAHQAQALRRATRCPRCAYIPNLTLSELTQLHSSRRTGVEGAPQQKVARGRRCVPVCADSRG